MKKSVGQGAGRRWVRGTAVAFGCLLGSGLAWGQAQSRSPLLDIDQMTFVASEGEDSRVLLRAEKARFDPRSDFAELAGVEATVFGEGSGVVFEMTCDRGGLDLVTNDFVASGNVLGRTQDGMVFSVDRVRYDNEGGVLSSDDKVQITDEGGTYRGGGFRFFVEDKRFQLIGGASVVQGR